MHGAADDAESRHTDRCCGARVDRVEACREAVWAALHDPDRLARCVPGCEAVQREDGQRYSVEARVGFGPLRAGFEGHVVVAGCEPFRHLVLVGEGRAGRVGAASGTATIELHACETGCRLAYALEARSAGPIAQLGSLVLGGLAQGMSDLFAQRFAAMFGPTDPSGVQPRRSRAKASRSPTISSSS